MFGIKTKLTSDEYDKVLKKVVALDAEVGQLNAKLEALNTSYNDLRGKFNRKLGILKKIQDGEGEEPQESETFNKPFTPW